MKNISIQRAIPKKDVLKRTNKPRSPEDRREVVFLCHKGVARTINNLGLRR